jgi:DNA-binding GntR family transcriptional regulator
MAINELVTPLKRQTLSSDVYAQLRELLITGQMIPGEQISLRTTASALGVSVMPVREAVHRLVPSRRWNSRPTARCACR